MSQRFRLLVLALLVAGVGVSEGRAAARKILAEIMTSTTCQPCYAADVFYFQNWLPNYGGADQIVTLVYHVWWPTPGNDPMYLANQAPVQTRVGYYFPVTAYSPYLFVDGFVAAGSAYNAWPGAIEPRFLDMSPIAISLTGTRDGSTLNMTASITAEQPVNSSTWRVHWALVESGISANQNTPSGYVSFVHEDVMRMMVPADGSGSPITISQGQTVDVHAAMTLDPSWVPANCRVIVFVQNNTDKKVQNAEVIGIDTLQTGVDDAPGAVPASWSLAQNYPNPFNPSTTIEYAVPGNVGTRHAVSLQVFDLLGRCVATLVDGMETPGIKTVRFDAGGLAGGVYFCRLAGDGVQQTRTMMLLK
jgi:hypothetical protein